MIPEPDHDDWEQTATRDLCVCAWNVQGLVSKRNNKMEDPNFVKCLTEYDVILCTETWTNSESKLNLNSFEYKAIHRARRRGAKRDSGGIIVFYRSELSSFVQLFKTKGGNVLWIKLSKEGFGQHYERCVTLHVLRSPNKLLSCRNNRRCLSTINR